VMDLSVWYIGIDRWVSMCVVCALVVF
jgi:hypothetical protein